MQKLKFYRYYLMIALSTLPLIGQAHHQVYYEQQHAEGWYWYQADLSQQNLAKQQFSQAASQHPIKLMNDLHKTLERNLDRAILNPTPQNVRAYMRLQFWAAQQSQLFATQWRQLLLSNTSS